ncbi:hypothetical protein VNO77_20722 [Canavalia gladiata]|uniref:Uncharacterized protein n=1 Tax=Canavalia gladiata TaxID=3824 RepID=A0AAN9LPS1_CANGL
MTCWHTIKKSRLLIFCMNFQLLQEKPKSFFPSFLTILEFQHFILVISIVASFIIDSFLFDSNLFAHHCQTKGPLVFLNLYGLEIILRFLVSPCRGSTQV